MKLLQILYSGLGGHSSVAFSLVEADKEKRYEHILLFFGIEDMPDAYINKCREEGISFYFIKKQPGKDKNANREMIATLERIGPGIVLLHSVNAILPVHRYCAAHKARLIAVEHQSNALKTTKEWLLSAVVMMLAKKVVYLTDVYRQEVRNRLRILYRPGKVSVINNGINMDLFQPRDKNPDGVIKIGMLSRLTPIKDHMTLVDAFAKLLNKDEKMPALELHIAGEGEMKQALESRVQELGITDHVFFRGMITERESADFLNSLDIYVHATFGETMSTAIMQAMACAKPIIASDVAGVNNMIGAGRTGLLVPVRQAERLADALQAIMTNKEQQQYLKENAFSYAKEHFSNRIMLERYAQLFS